MRFKGLTEVLLEIKVFLGCDAVHFKMLGTTCPMTRVTFNKTWVLAMSWVE